MQYEELKQQFIDNGFEVNGDVYTKETIDNSNVTIINGQRQVRKVKFTMKYAGEGWSMNEDGSSDSDTTPLFLFDMVSGDELPEVTLGIETYEDFTKFVNV